MHQLATCILMLIVYLSREPGCLIRREGEGWPRFRVTLTGGWGWGDRSSSGPTLTTHQLAVT
jgi:hypothetical protein